MTSLNPAASSPQHAFSCALTAVLLARVRSVAGDTGVHRLLDEAGSSRSMAYLEDVANWVGFDEAIALWQAGESVTYDPNFARHVGEDAVKVLAGTATATTLRSLGSPEEHIRRLRVSSQRFSTAAVLEAVEVRAGYAEVRAVAAPGFGRHRLQCEWTAGLLSQSTSLFGLPAARVDHCSCQALGAPDCIYTLAWETTALAEGDAAQVSMLRSQLDALSARLEGVFATAADLITSGDLDETLARIAHRAAEQVRAPSYLLAVRPAPESDLVFHHMGLDAEDAPRVAERVLSDEDAPDHWCVANVQSHRRDYGRLAAMYPVGSQFLPQEREMLELYARYAATALDSATALLEARTGRDEAQRRHEEARTLLELARLLASAGTTEQVAQRLANAVPGIVDCDRVSVWLWQEEAGEIVRCAVNSGSGEELVGTRCKRPEEIPQLAAWLEHPDPEPYFIDMEKTAIRESLDEVGAVASVTVPIATAHRFLGAVQVSVRYGPERLAPSPELNDRLSGLAAHAVIALENGRLVDHITHQARHDQLTGLHNRLAFSERVHAASGRARKTSSPLALFFIDLDRFKPVNDEFGHDVGDRLLHAVAERLTGCVRSGDALARLGGDEFAVLVEDVESEAQLRALSDRLEQAFRAPFVIDGRQLSVGASVGRAAWPSDVGDVDGLVREADAAMYRAKRSRRMQTNGASAR